MQSFTENRKFLIGLVAIGAVVLAASGGALYMLTQTPGAPVATSQPTFEIPPDIQLSPIPSLGDLATRYPDLGELLSDPALDSVYKEFLVAYETGGIEAARELAVQRGLLNEKDEVRITLVIDSEENVPAVAEELDKFGVIVEGTYRDLIDIAVPMMFIEQFAQTEDPGKLFQELTQLKHVIKLRLPIPTQVGEHLPKVEGVDVTGAAEWHAAGLTGQGVKVGVLDLGFDGYRNLLGKELPERVVAESFARGQEPDSTGEVHGAACAEIVHAMAPDAELYLAYYDGSEVGMGRAVEWLVEQDVDIITHSANGLVGPMDGSSAQAKLVDEVVAKGIVWVNSSGNYATEHYRGTFNDTDGDGIHEFSNGKEVMGYMPPGGSATVILNWYDWPNTDQDFDLFLFDKDLNLVASSQNTQGGQNGDSPFEGFRLKQLDQQVYYIVIKAKNATRSVTFDLFAPNGEIELPSPSYSLGTPSDAFQSLTVGAIEWSSSGLEDFSSQGPTNDDRLKPELAAPDRVTTASYAPRSFPGTSASTPHVAGAAALVLGAFPDYTPEQVKDYLFANAQDLGPGGPDTAFGYGSLHLPQPPQAGQPEPEPVKVPPTPVQVVPAPVTPAPPTQPETGGGSPLVVLLCLSTMMCIGAIGMFGGAVLLIVLARPKSRPPVQRPYAPPVPPIIEEACLLTSDGARTLLRTGENSVGRSHENDIAFPDDNQVSRRHAVVNWDGQRCSVMDLGSSNGTFVNGNRLTPNVPHPLRTGDRVRFGPDAKFVVRLPTG